MTPETEVRERLWSFAAGTFDQRCWFGSHLQVSSKSQSTPGSSKASCWARGSVCSDVRVALTWVASRELNLSYYNKETLVFTIYPYSGRLNYVP